MIERGIIDRFEGDIAVIEFSGGTRIREYRREALPADAVAGDAVILSDDGKLSLDPETTAARKRDIQDLMDELFE
ncbi:DUF3006 domain-containing protein [Cohnella sp. GCM10027633]|uniref:DUF3006 domain-containing protein n=1 Tax=unclassified Cohnella TaxID=2636738 RepID=UPI00362D4BED